MSDVVKSSRKIPPQAAGLLLRVETLRRAIEELFTTPGALDRETEAMTWPLVVTEDGCICCAREDCGCDGHGSVLLSIDMEECEIEFNLASLLDEMVSHIIWREERIAEEAEESEPTEV